MPTSSKATRRLTTIMEADVVGYSRLMIEDEISTLANLERSLMVFRTTIAEFDGRVVNVAGDSLLAEFKSASDSVECALRIQEELAKLNLTPAMQFRIGIDLGDVLETGESLFGNGVNIAARMETEAKPGGICLTGSVYEAASRKLEAYFEFIGEKQVKNVPQPIRTYSVSRHAPAEIHASRKPGLATMVAAIGMLLVALAVTWFFLHETDGPNAVSVTQDQTPASNPASQTQSSDEAPIPSLAILPFENLSDDKNQDYFADGISEDLITNLSRNRDLRVLSRNSTFRFRDQNLDLRKIQNELKATHILEGSVRRSGNYLRITARLVELASGGSLWSQRYDRTLDEVFKVQDDVVRNISSSLLIKLANTETTTSPRNTSSFEAYDLSLKGRRSLSFRTREANLQAQEYYERAIAVDPTYARAYGGMAVALTRYANEGWAEAPISIRDLALEYARKAVELDPDFQNSYWALGFTHIYRREYLAATKAARKALEIAPGYADAMGLLAMIHNFSGEPREARQLMEKAIIVNPLYTWEYLFVLGWAEYGLGNYQKANELLKIAVGRNANSVIARLTLTASYVALGELEDAQWQVDELLHYQPDMSVSFLINGFPMDIRKEPVQRYIEHLRQAGLPE